MPETPTVRVNAGPSWTHHPQTSSGLGDQPEWCLGAVPSVPGVPVDLFMCNELDDEQVAALLRVKS